MAFNSYYSGDLATINQGRTADAAVAAQDASSQRAFLAAVMAERGRRQTAEREIAVRETLGLGDLGVRRGDTALRRELGLGELGLGGRRLDEVAAERGVRRELGLGELDVRRGDASIRRELGIGELDLGRQRLAEVAADRGVRRELGLGQITLGEKQIGENAADREVRRELGLGTLQEAANTRKAETVYRWKQLDQEFRLKSAELDTMKQYYQQGGGTDSRMRTEMMKLQQELQLLNAEAEAAAVQANGAIQQELDAIGNQWMTWRSTAEDNWKKGDPETSDTVMGNVMTRLGTQAPMVRFDPASRRYMPRLFQSPMPMSIGTPGINPTLPTPAAGATNAVDPGIEAILAMIRTRINTPK